MDRSNLPVNRELAIRAVWEWSGSPGLDHHGVGRPSGDEIAEVVQQWFSELGVFSHWTPSARSNLITRREMAQLIDASIKPFVRF